MAGKEQKMIKEDKEIKDCRFKILTIVGARPQFIKSAIFTRSLSKRDDLKEVLVHTGQHYDENMSRIFFEELGMRKEDYNLNINGGNHGEQTGRMLIDIERVVMNEKPDMIVVFGDTNSTLAGALVGSKLQIPVAHIESGFRSHDMSMPEEINRIVADHVSAVLLCPTKTCIDELKNENVTENVHFTGDITYDAVMEYSKFADGRKDCILDRLHLKKGSYIYSTVHRQGNTDSRESLENIFGAFLDSKETFVIPIHPRTKSKMIDFGIWNKYQGKTLVFIDPVGFFDSLELGMNCKKFVTDSGGLLKEAYYFRKPCIILRDTVEFIETVQNGEAILAGTDRKKILSAIKDFKGKGKYPSFFGEGDSVGKIIGILSEYLKKRKL